MAKTTYRISFAMEGLAMSTEIEISQQVFDKQLALLREQASEGAVAELEPVAFNRGAHAEALYRFECGKATTVLHKISNED